MFTFEFKKYGLTLNFLRVKELSGHLLTIFTKFDNTVSSVAGLSA